MGVALWCFRSIGVAKTYGIVYASFRLNTHSLETFREKGDTLSQTMDRMGTTLVAVSTGGPQLNTVNDQYKADYALVNEQTTARGMGIPDQVGPAHVGSVW